MIAGEVRSTPFTVAEDKLCIHNSYISVIRRPDPTYIPVFGGSFITMQCNRLSSLYITVTINSYSSYTIRKVSEEHLKELSLPSVSLGFIHSVAQHLMTSVPF